MDRQARRRTGNPFCGAFRYSESAVSPVISTILMVAITVVLAATAFVLVADVGSNVADPAPNVGFQKDDEADRLTVTQADIKANWDRILLTLTSDQGTDPIYLGSSAGVVNEEAANTGILLLEGARTDIVSGSLSMGGGDSLEFCRDGPSDGPFTISITDAVANQLMGDWQFDGVEVC